MKRPAHSVSAESESEFESLLSEETVVVSPSRVADASSLSLEEEPALAPSVSPRSISSPLTTTEASSITSEEIDGGPTTS
ncbi:hypothetical protein AMTR_s00073p00037890 [Amborella trichopoda]|uniref:Uncharacterized protein n=1 Tax=Amborella trichopoda TaxID=13333 RepID=W1NNM3_AMBTC|nr:hypothetical protein AMTR_s00073p00037890 [Amborella trichopoda]